MPRGRPKLYTPELGLELCSRLVGTDGSPKSLVTVCNADDMPCYKTVMVWLNDPELKDFSQNYHRAREHRTEIIFEQLRDIAEKPLVGEITITKETKDGKFVEVKQADNVQRSDLMVKTAMWQLARMAPKKYGDRQILAGDPENPIASQTIVIGSALEGLPDSVRMKLRQALIEASKDAEAIEGK